MKKIIIIIVCILLTGVFSGCIEEQKTATIAPLNYIVNDVYESRNEEREIQQVYVEIQNFDDRDIKIIMNNGLKN